MGYDYSFKTEQEDMVNFYDTRIGRYFRNWKYNSIFNSLNEGDIAIDCGANVGKVTQRMARSGAIVYAFEPDPNAFKELEKSFGNIKNVVLFNKAVSDYSGNVKLYFNDRYNEDPKKWSVGSTLVEDKPHVDKSNFVEVEVIDLTEFINNLQKPVTLIKIDVEGEEIRILNKLIDTGLAKKVENILVETHERFPVLKNPTEDLRKKIKDLNIKNIDLDWA